MARNKGEQNKAWQSKYPHLPEGFLKQALEAGFDLHHLDHDSQNNTPDNLVLIYGGDHMALHGLNMKLRDALVDLTKGEQAYRLREAGESWEAIRGQVCRSAMLCAKHWAKKHDARWPVKSPVVHARLKAAKKERDSKHRVLEGEIRVLKKKLDTLGRKKITRPVFVEPAPDPMGLAFPRSIPS